MAMCKCILPVNLFLKPILIYIYIYIYMYIYNQIEVILFLLSKKTSYVAFVKELTIKVSQHQLGSGDQP
jgi:hypothetical protein